MRSPNFEKTKASYTETLGFPIVGTIPGSPVVFIAIGGTTIELSSAKPGEAPVRGNCGLMHLAWEVDDVDATYAELSAKGVPFHILPRNAGDIRLAFFRDPDGNDLELFKSPTITWAK
jgi:catechol 2,3-dioxygenase-like lactoylglutathione lyase family enzyme